MTARGVAHLVVHGTTGSTSYETIPHVRLETSGFVGYLRISKEQYTNNLQFTNMLKEKKVGPTQFNDSYYTNDRGHGGATTRRPSPATPT